MLYPLLTVSALFDLILYCLLYVTFIVMMHHLQETHMNRHNLLYLEITTLCVLASWSLAVSGTTGL